MSTDLDIRPDLSNGDTDDDDWQHIVCCCSENVALCGKDVTNDDVIDDANWDDTYGCRRCLELEGQVCILCGWDPQTDGCFCGKCL